MQNVNWFLQRRAMRHWQNIIAPIHMPLGIGLNVFGIEWTDIEEILFPGGLPPLHSPYAHKKNILFTR